MCFCMRMHMCVCGVKVLSGPPCGSLETHHWTTSKLVAGPLPASEKYLFVVDVFWGGQLVCLDLPLVIYKAASLVGGGNGER